MVNLIWSTVIRGLPELENIGRDLPGNVRVSGSWFKLSMANEKHQLGSGGNQLFTAGVHSAGSRWRAHAREFR